MNYASHIGQDRWVFETLRGKRGGYFLDFGAFDGVNHSNTFTLERLQGWGGICVEPNPLFYAATCAVRSCITVNAALWPVSRQSLSFVDAHGLSSLAEFRDADQNSALRHSVTRRTIAVDTINPTELLARFDAPTQIEYLSLDVEGAELQVIQALDLGRYRVVLMSIEHNHDTAKQAAVRAHLAPLGYQVVDCRNDDFFFHPGLLAQLPDGFEDPVAVCQRVQQTYRLREY